MHGENMRKEYRYVLRKREREELFDRLKNTLERERECMEKTLEKGYVWRKWLRKGMFEEII